MYPDEKHRVGNYSTLKGSPVRNKAGIDNALADLNISRRNIYVHTLRSSSSCRTNTSIKMAEMAKSFLHYVCCNKLRILTKLLQGNSFLQTVKFAKVLF